MDKREALTPQELQWLQEAQEAERFDKSEDTRGEMQAAMAAAMQKATAGPHAGGCCGGHAGHGCCGKHRNHGKD